MIEIIKPLDTERLKKLSKDSVQSFDKKKIEITKAGKTYNVYDAIQANREDTEIYPTLEKYGNLQTMERTPKDIANGISEIMTISDLMMQERQLIEYFEDLPRSERNKFDNNYYIFKKSGYDYYVKKAKEEIAEVKKIKEQNNKIEVPQNDTNK